MRTCIVLAVLTLALALRPGVRAEEPVAPPPPAPEATPRSVDWLPKDCVFALHLDLKAMRAQFGQTPFAKFMAEPDTLAFLAQPVRMAGQAYEQWRERYSVLPTFAALEQLSSGDLAVGLRLLAPLNAEEPPRPTLCLSIRLKDPNATMAAMANVFEPLPAVKLENGVEARGGEGMYLAIVDSWLLAAADTEGLAKLAGAARDGTPSFSQHARWKQAQAKVGTGCVATAWADLRPIRLNLLRLPDDPNARAALPPSPAKVLAALGLDGVQSLSLGLAFDGPRADFRIGIEAPAEARRGLLKLIEGEGALKAGLLASVPPEAGWFYVTRMDLRRLLPLLREGLSAAEGTEGMGQNMPLQLLAFSLATGVNLERDLLANFGEEWVVCDSGGGGALMDLMPALAVTGLARDPERLEAALRSLFMIAARNAPANLDARYHNVLIEGVNVHYIGLAMTDISPCFALVGNRVVLSPTLGSLRRQVRHLMSLPNAKDIRSNPEFEAACKAAFGKALPAAGAEGDAAELPATLRYLDPKRSQPTKLLGSLFGAGTAFGPNLPEILKAEEGLRKARLLAALRVMSGALDKFRPKEGAAARALPANPRDLLKEAGGHLAVATDLGGIRYRAGLKTDDAPETIVAFALIERDADRPYALVRLSGKVETFSPEGIIAELKEQAAAFKAQQRDVKELGGSGAPLERANTWWTKAWGVQEEERSLITADLLRLVRGIDFALLPDVRRFEAGLAAGVSWTTADEWGMVSRTLTSYPLPAADLTGAAVPFVIACVTVPEIAKGRKANNESGAVASLKAIAGAQAVYKLADWDDDQVHGYAGSLAELTARGLLDARIAAAESRAGGFLVPKNGYLFRVLPAQGKAAPGGEKNYQVNGKWVNGYAVLAWPADYPKDGDRSFLLGPNGAVYAADLGVFTPASAKNMQAFDPDPNAGWRPAE